MDKKTVNVGTVGHVDHGKKRLILCRLGIHISDKDYCDPYWGKGLQSHCKHCDKTLRHWFKELFY